MANLVCSECGERLPEGTHPSRLTCPDTPDKPSCANRRKQRLKSAARKAARQRAKPRSASGGLEHDYRGEPMHQAAIPSVSGVSSAIDEIGHKVIAEELRPMIRQALTDNVLDALTKLVGITPDIVARLAEDVNDEDPVVRQKAYGLVLRYVLGHGAVQPKDEAERATMTVLFESMPRPAPDATSPEPPQLPEPAVEVEADELKPCEDCNVEKPVTEFDNDAPRCRQCVAEYKAKRVEQFGLEL